MTHIMEEYFSNHIFHKIFVLILYEEHLQLIDKNINNPIKKWPKNLIKVSPKKIYKQLLSQWKDDESLLSPTEFKTKVNELVNTQLNRGLLSTSSGQQDTNQWTGGNVKWYGHFG